MTSIETRPARPEDAAPAAHLVFLSAPSVFTQGLALQAEEVEALLQSLWPLPGHLFSHSWSHVVTIDGRVQGLLLGYAGRQIPKATLATARALRQRVSWRQIVRMARGSLPLLSAVPWVPWSDYYIAHLAVMPEARRQGIGAQLLALAEGIARETGCRRCALDVLTQNEPAIRVYRRAGYTVERTMCNAKLLATMGCNGFHRMIKRV